MLQHQKIWLPDGETHLTHWMTVAGEIVDGKGSYQIKKLRRALSYCKSFRTAVDVGAHVGTWSMQLAKRFERVHSFEPVEAHRECFAKNLEGVENVTLHPCALGDHAGTVSIRTAPTSSGDSWVDGDGDIPLRKLDRFRLQDVDVLKADVEGYELCALKGGEQTIRRCMPVIIVEQKKGRAQKFGLGETEAVDWLRGLGYRMAEEMSGDFIMVPR